MCILSLFLIACVSASDLNETMGLESDSSLDRMQNTLSETENAQKGLSFDEEALGATDAEVIGTNYTPHAASEIQTCVDSANDGDIIILDGNYVLQSTISVNKPLTFVGKNNAIIDGSSNIRLFTINNRGVIFKNITFKNGYSQEGGAIHGFCTVINCTFINNSALAGGAVYRSDVFNSTFIGNIAQVEYGTSWGQIDYGRIYSGGAICEGNANNCTFINNSAQYGGAIFQGNANNCSFIGNNATRGGANYKCTSLNSVFTNNHADYGGAVYAGSFKYCIFNNNSAINEGNEIYLDSTEIYSSVCSLENCKITNSVSNGNWMISYKGISKLMINNFSFINCSSSANGGAVNLKYGQVYFTNCYFERNSAKKGGAIYYNEYIMALENCYFKNNSAEYGGAIYTEFMNDIGKCSFETNNAIYGGSEILFNGTGNLKLTNCNFTKCVSNVDRWFIEYSNINSLTIDSCNFINCSSEGNGGAIVIKDDSKYSISNSYFEGNRATNGGVIYSKMNAFSCDNCTFADNNAEFGGVFYLDKVSMNGITNCNFINNSATNGGAFYSNYGNFWMDNCNFTENFARFGGALYINNCQFSNITNCVFQRNNGNGAGIYFERSISQIDNCKFIDQFAFITYRTSYGYYAVEGDGGALYVVDSEIKVYNSEFNSNEAYLDTGAILGYAEVFNCSFYKNVGGHSPYSSGAMKGGIAINSTFEDNHGYRGAAILEGSAINCTFINNHLSDGTDGSGGAIYNTDAFNCTFINNVAIYGGAMYGGSASDCTFIGNSASNGGAVFASSVENSIFSDCFAFKNGGAIYSNSDISNCTFINCSARNGGAIVFDTSDPISLTHSQFIDCHADNHSGAVDFGKSRNLTISKCSFKNCTSGDNGGYLGINDDADVYVEDCVFDEIPEDIPVHYTSYFTVNNLEIILGENAILLVNLSNVQGPLFNKTIIFSIGSERYNSTTDNTGLAICDLKEYLTSPGKYTIGVDFLGDEENSNATVNANVTVNSYRGILIVNAEGKYYDDVTLTVKLDNSKTLMGVYNATINVEFSNGQTIYLKTDKNGVARYMVPFAPGTYSAVVSVSDENVDVSNVTLSNFVISDIVGKMSVAQVDNNVLNIRVFNPSNGDAYKNINVTLKFESFDPIYGITNEQGVFSYTMPFDYGTYSVVVSVFKEYTQIDSVLLDNIVIGEDESYSKVKFSSGIVFEYGGSGSIYVTVEGGTIEPENIKVLNHNEAKITLIKNIITVSNLNPGQYTLFVESTPYSEYKSGNGTVSITVKKATAVIKSSKVTVAYKKGQKWTIKFADSRNNQPIKDIKVTLKVFTGKKYKTVRLTTNSKGEVSYQTKSLSKGTHKVVVTAEHAGYNFSPHVSSIKVIKQTPLKFTLKTRVNDNEGSLLSYTVSNKKTNAGVNGVKFKVLIFTGKKYKTYTLKTKKVKGKKGTYNGAIGFSTNKFSAGKHTVKFIPASIKYKGTLTTSIQIKKKATSGPKYFREV